jgi:hypothetical protein
MSITIDDMDRMISHGTLTDGAMIALFVRIKVFSSLATWTEFAYEHMEPSGLKGDAASVLVGLLINRGGIFYEMGKRIGTHNFSRTFKKDKIAAFKAVTSKTNALPFAAAKDQLILCVCLESLDKFEKDPIGKLIRSQDQFKQEFDSFFCMVSDKSGEWGGVDMDPIINAGLNLNVLALKVAANLDLPTSGMPYAALAAEAEQIMSSQESDLRTEFSWITNLFLKKNANLFKVPFYGKGLSDLTVFDTLAERLLSQAESVLSANQNYTTLECRYPHAAAEFDPRNSESFGGGHTRLERECTCVIESVLLNSESFSISELRTLRRVIDVPLVSVAPDGDGFSYSVMLKFSCGRIVELNFCDHEDEVPSEELILHTACGDEAPFKFESRSLLNAIHKQLCPDCERTKEFLAAEMSMLFFENNEAKSYRHLLVEDAEGDWGGLCIFLQDEIDAVTCAQKEIFTAVAKMEGAVLVIRQGSHYSQMEVARRSSRA